MPEFSAAGVALSAGLDWRVLLFALAVTALVTVLAGAAPALFAASVRPLHALKEQSASVAGGLGLRKALVVGQFALALVLLIGAGLFARTLATLRAQGPGFATSNLLMFRIAPTADGLSFDESKPLFRRVLAEVQALPDVDQAGVAAWEHVAPRWLEQSGDGRFAAARRTEESLPMNAVSAGFFDTLGRARDARARLRRARFAE